MTRRLASVVTCLLALATFASAQVADGSYWTDGAGTTASVDVTETSDTGVDVTVTDSTGFTAPMKGTQSSGSTAENPKAKSSVEGETNSPQPNQYRVRNGKLQKKNAQGKWVDMRKTRKKNNIQRPPRAVTNPVFGPGEEGTSNPGGPQSL